MANYWKGWPSKGPYIQDLKFAEVYSKKYLTKIKNIPSPKKYCVVFDIDDTLVFGDPDKEIGVREMELGEHDGQDIFILPRNDPIVEIARFAKKLGFIIVVLTARPKESRGASVANMRYFGIPFDAIIVNNKDEEPCFKVKVRQNIANKYNIALTIGDQATDCIFPGEKTAAIKLPDPTSKVTYAWFPPGV